MWRRNLQATGRNFEQLYSVIDGLNSAAMDPVNMCYNLGKGREMEVRLRGVGWGGGEGGQLYQIFWHILEAMDSPLCAPHFKSPCISEPGEGGGAEQSTCGLSIAVFIYLFIDWWAFPDTLN